MEPAAEPLERQIEELAAAAAAGDRAARARCVEVAFPVVRELALRYSERGVSRQDLEQEVALGLLRALERYDPARGTPFLAWAQIWIRQTLQQAIAENSRPLRLTRYALWDLHEAQVHPGAPLAGDAREPTAMQLAEALRWPLERVEQVLLSGQTAEHPDALDLVDDPLTPAAFDDVIARVTADQLRPLLLELPERDREILTRRANDETLRTIARSLGLSHQRVAALEERAFSKVRAAADITSGAGRA